MPYIPATLQNASSYPGNQPTIVISVEDPEWQAALSRIIICTLENNHG